MATGGRAVVVRYRRLGWATPAQALPGPEYKAPQTKRLAGAFPIDTTQTLKRDCVDSDGHRDSPETTTAEAAGRPGCLHQRKFRWV